MPVEDELANEKRLKTFTNMRSYVTSCWDLQTCRGKSSKYFGYCRLHQNYSVQSTAPRASVWFHSTFAEKR